MYCSNCGNEVAQGTKFCPACGAQMTVQPQYQPEEQYAQPEVQYQPEMQYQPELQRTAASAARQRTRKRKKKTNILIPILVVVAALLAGKLIGGGIANSFKDKDQDTSVTGNAPGLSAFEEVKTRPDVEISTEDAVQEQTTTLPDIPNAAYSKIFTDRNIIEMPALFLGLDSEAFASVDANGYVHKVEYGYQDDTIHEVVETVYVPVDGWSEADKTTLDSNVRAQYSSYESLGFVTVNYSMGSLFYSVSITTKDLDQSSNIQAAVDAGILVTPDGTDVLSMKMTEDSLLAEGYAKR